MFKKKKKMGRHKTCSKNLEFRTSS